MNYDDTRGGTLLRHTPLLSERGYFHGNVLIVCTDRRYQVPTIFAYDGFTTC